MTKNSNKINLDKIEKLLSTSSTSSIYDTLSKIQLGEMRGEEKEEKLGIALNGFTKHTTLIDATQKGRVQEEEPIIPIPEPTPSVIQEPEVIETFSPQKVSIISTTDYQFGDVQLTVAGKELTYKLKIVLTNRHSEKIKTDINGSDAGIILLPPFSDTSEIQTIINKHVSELWSYNGLGPVPFVLVVLEDHVKAGSLALGDLEKSIETFIENLTPITRGNYGFGVKCHIVKELDSAKELKKILRTLSILLISFQRFKNRKSSRNI